MYSPNGIGCRLTYAASGPSSGNHTIEVFWTFSSSAVGTSVPTRVGASTASTAAEMSALVRASAYGLMSEEFSGQTTRSGCSTEPACTCSASRLVTPALFRVITLRWSL